MSSMRIGNEVRLACRIHARLLDAFIALTEEELRHLPPGFAEESLRESLEQLRAGRKGYGTVGGVAIAISNAA